MRPTLLGHSKFKRLVSILKCPRSHAVGYLEMIWQAAYESGDDFIGDAVDVELAAEWNGTQGELVKALLDCGGESRKGFIEPVDGGYAVHDLFDHAPDYVFNRSSREQERKKVKSCEYCNSTYHSPDRRSKYCSDNCRKSMSRDGKRQTETDKLVSETDCPRTPSPSPSPSPAQETKVRERVLKESPLVRYLIETYPDIKNPVEFEAKAKDAYPDVDLLAEAKRASAWEVADPKRKKILHGRFLMSWWGRKPLNLSIPIQSKPSNDRDDVWSKMDKETGCTP